mgnify:CR=1 FL=1
MGATTKFTAGESADALSYMALAGWDTQSMLDGISPVLNLAAAANMDLAQASDIVTDYLTAFGLKASDTTHFVDVMAYAMANSNTDVIQLGEAYKACAATATSLGYSVEETTAVLGYHGPTPVSRAASWHGPERHLHPPCNQHERVRGHPCRIRCADL